MPPIAKIRTLPRVILKLPSKKTNLGNNMVYKVSKAHERPDEQLFSR